MGSTNFSEYSGPNLREEYLNTRRGDLTTYAGMIGEGFSSTLNRLAQLIGNAHEPSLGAYKERLLMNLIRDFVPKRYEVGTGFVLFPSEYGKIPDENVPWNLHKYKVSKQLDIIVYDSFNYPIIFKDGDFVIVRPEAVCSIVEVKGALDTKQITSFMDLFIDFARKWVETDLYYRKNRLTPLGYPKLLVMNWLVAVDSKGKPRSNGRLLRKKIAEEYRKNISPEEIRSARYPLLRTAYIYNDCYVCSSLYSPDEEKTYAGYWTLRGKFIQYNDKTGEPILGPDKTVSDLLSEIQDSLDTPKNRIFSNVDQVGWPGDFPHRDDGFDACFTGADLMASSTDD
ncbi:MAG: hypothetical protein APF81_13355 [Desulfosporosinus sp. BRH_c37]|nr:MAG: hypothetical protein APF81_13355 [Desulfosporosinus sp. BRH_c37]